MSRWFYFVARGTAAPHMYPTVFLFLDALHWPPVGRKKRNKQFQRWTNKAGALAKKNKPTRKQHTSTVFRMQL